MMGTLLRPELVSEGRCALLSGPPGRSKTHLAVAFAYPAIQNGFEARFTSADEMIGECSHAARPGRLKEALEPYVHPHVLVIDELGYQSYAADAANVLFRLVSLRLAALGHVLHDADLTKAILDRLVERGTHFVLRGRSSRTRHHPEEVISCAEDLRRSARRRPKFREKPRHTSENPQLETSGRATVGNCPCSRPKQGAAFGLASAGSAPDGKNRKGSKVALRIAGLWNSKSPDTVETVPGQLLGSGGPGRTRTSDLTLIRRAL